MFWVTAAKELLLRKLQSPQVQATQSDLILQFREQGFHLTFFAAVR
jgi:hypothetical protein